MRISELAIYPLKSARQLPLNELVLDEFGPAGDRRWMLVDSDGCYVTQRTLSRLCLVTARPSVVGLVLEAPGMRPLAVRPEGERYLPVSIWGERLSALAPSPEADAWLGDFLQRPLRLVFLPAGQARAVNPAFAGPGQFTAFSDGFPLLLVTQSSLDQLNRLLMAEGGRPVDWRRFRPNVVVAGEMPPHAEDGWKRLRVGEVELALVKPCSRCVIPSIDPDTADRNSQILTILRRYRSRGDGRIYLGQNVVLTRRPPGSRLRVGDAVEILE